MNGLSVVVITYNEEKNIERCLQSVLPVADEIIVLDAYSTDNTVAIAKKNGARVVQDVFGGYIQQKNKALAFAGCDYVLSLDADEAIDARLRDAILSLKAGFAAAAYSMNRCTNYCGRFIRRGTWYPDCKVRLFDKRVARWGGTNPHDRIELRTPDNKVQHLRGDILHHSFPTIEDHIQKSNKYSSIAARAMWLKGKRSNWIKLLLNPSWAFFHCYFIRLGLLEGFAGFAIAVISAHSTFLKYAKLYQLQHSRQPAVKGGIFSPAEHAKAL